MRFRYFRSKRRLIPTLARSALIQQCRTARSTDTTIDYYSRQWKELNTFDFKVEFESYNRKLHAQKCKCKKTGTFTPNQPKRRSDYAIGSISICFDQFYMGQHPNKAFRAHQFFSSIRTKMKQKKKRLSFGRKVRFNRFVMDCCRYTMYTRFSAANKSNGSILISNIDIMQLLWCENRLFDSRIVLTNRT